MSATLGGQFLQTTDRKRDGYDTVEPFDPELASDSNEELDRWPTAELSAFAGLWNVNSIDKNSKAFERSRM